MRSPAGPDPTEYAPVPPLPVGEALAPGCCERLWRPALYGVRVTVTLPAITSPPVFGASTVATRVSVPTPGRDTHGLYDEKRSQGALL